LRIGTYTLANHTRHTSQYDLQCIQRKEVCGMAQQQMSFERHPYEETPAETVSQTIGLAAAVGLLIGALLGTLLAIGYLDTSLGEAVEVLIGALGGGLIGLG